MRRIKLSENLVLKLLSIALALTLWLYVQGQQPQSIYEGIQTFRNVEIDWITDSGYIVTAITSREADITLAGSIDTVNLINSQDVSISLDLTGYTKGKHSILVQPDIPAGVRIFNLTPQKVDVVLDNWVEKSVDVVIQYTETLPDNAIIEETIIEPSQVTVSGAEELVKDVDRVIVEYDYIEMLEEVVGLDVRAVNSSGVTLPNVNIDEFVNLKVVINYYKAVPVVLNRDVEITEDMNIRLTPASVIIKGSQEDIDEIEFIETETFSVDDFITAEEEFVLELIYPENITPLGEEMDKVTLIQVTQ